MSGGAGDARATPDPSSAVRVPEAARRTGLSSRKLYDLIAAGTLPAHRDVNGMVVIDAKVLGTIHR